MDPRTQATTAVALLTELVDATTAEQLTAPTPCTAWDVRALMNHLVGGGHLFAAGLEGTTLEGDPGADLVGADHRAAYHAAIDRFSAALAQCDDLERPVSLPFATLPAAAALQLASGDLLVHAWDLATATGRPFAPPTELVEAAYAFYRVAVTDELRAGGMFGPARPVADDAPPLTRLLAHAGRQG